MLRTVICGVDHAPFAHSVVEAAAALADGLDATLVLAHATGSQLPLGAAAPHPGFAGWAPMDPSCEESPFDLLDRMLPHAGEVAAETVVTDGEPVGALCRLADRSQASLLVVGSRGMGPIGRLLLRSVSTEVTRRAPCPVVVIPHVAMGDVERPLVDGSTVVCGIGGPADRPVAAVAAELAAGLELRLRLAHALPPLRDAEWTPAGPAVRSQSPRMALLRRMLGEIVEDYPWLDGQCDFRLVGGDPAAELADLAARSHAAAVVVGARQRGGLRLRRDLAATLVRTATVPVAVCQV